MIVAEAAPAVPVVAGAAWLLIGFGVLFAYLTMFGLKTGYDYSLGALLNRMAQLTSHVWAVGGSISHAVDSVNHWVENRLADGLSGTELAVAKWWHGMEWIVTTTADTLAQFGMDVEAGFAALVNGVIPATIATNTAALERQLHNLRAQATAIAGSLVQLMLDRTHAIETTVARDFGAALRGIDDIRGAVSERLGTFGRAVEAEIAGLRGYVNGALTRRVEAALAGAGAGALAWASVSALSAALGLLRCTNVQKAARAACRMDTGALDALLAGTLIIGGTLSVVTFAEACIDAQDEVVPFLKSGIRELQGL